MRPEKKYLVEEAKSRLSASDFLFLVNFTGVTVKAAAEFREALAKAGAQYHVVKNSIIALAAKELGLPDMSEVLAGPTGIVSDEQGRSRIPRQPPQPPRNARKVPLPPQHARKPDGSRAVRQDGKGRRRACGSGGRVTRIRGFGLFRPSSLFENFSIRPWTQFCSLGGDKNFNRRRNTARLRAGGG